MEEQQQDQKLLVVKKENLVFNYIQNNIVLIEFLHIMAKVHLLLQLIGTKYILNVKKYQKILILFLFYFFYNLNIFNFKIKIKIEIFLKKI